LRKQGSRGGEAEKEKQNGAHAKVGLPGSG